MKKTYKMKALKVKMKMKMQKACNPIKIQKMMKIKKTNQVFQKRKVKKLRNNYFQMLTKIQKLMNKMI